MTGTFCNITVDMGKIQFVSNMADPALHLALAICQQIVLGRTMGSSTTATLPQAGEDVPSAYKQAVAAPGFRPKPVA